MGRKMLSVLLILWILCLMPMTAFAESLDYDRTGSISVTLRNYDGTPITGVELSLYHVAVVGHNSAGNLSYNYTNAFKDCGFELDDPALAAKLNTYVKERSFPATKLVTDDHGTVTFANLALGNYFIQQSNTVPGYTTCTPFLVTVPNHDSNGYVYDVNASPKTEITKLTDITIKKVWNTGSSAKATDSVTVQLLKDDVVIETATLNAQNKWQVTYKDMPESDGYRIVEVSVPRGFTATYSKKGYEFTVTNSSSLAQTGQLVWPIPVLAMAGLVLIAIGAIVLRKPRDEHA